MARIVKLRFNGIPNHFDVYYYGGLTGKNFSTAIKIEPSVNADIDFDLTGKVQPSGNYNRELSLVLKASTGAEFPLDNLIPTPDWDHYLQGGGGGSQYVLNPPLKWEDGDLPNRYTFTVKSTGPGPVEPDAIVNIEFVGTPAQFEVGYVSGIVGAGTIPNTGPQAFNLKGKVATTGDTNRRLPITIKPKAGYQVDSVTTVPVGPYNEYLAKNAWTWSKSGVNYTTDAVNTMASATLYKINVVTSLIPVAPKTCRFKFVGDLTHFDASYSGGITGGADKPIETGVEVVFNLADKVGSTASNNRLTFKVSPKNVAVTILDVKTDPRAPTNPVMGKRNWMWGKGSLPYFTCDATIETASDVLYTFTVVSEGPKPEIVSPFNKLFSLSRDKMIELSNSMLGVWGDAAGAPASSGFLINLLVLPFSIPSEVLGSEQKIKIGSVGTNVTAPLIDDDSIDVDLGNIVVAGLSNSVLDYAAANYELVLPFFGKSLELVPSQVVGKTINARYVLDAYTGDATVNVFNDDTGVPIASAVDRVARAIPFKMFSDVANKQDGPVQTNNDILQAFIRVTRKEVVSGVYDNLVQVNGVLGSSKGYMEVQNVELRGVPDSDRVKSILQSGVVIK